MRRLSLALVACLMSGLLSACSVFGGTTGSKYVVFFNSGSASLDRPARKVVSNAADAAADNPSVDILVEGYAAAHGSVSADERLAASRGQAVAAALRADGVAANRIQLSPRQPSNEDPVVGARRVEIAFSH